MDIQRISSQALWSLERRVFYSFVIFYEFSSGLGSNGQALHEVEADFENLVRTHSQMLERAAAWAYTDGSA